MPELPEVETIRRQLRPRLLGRTIIEAGSHPSAKFTPATATTGASIVDVGRRGKYLLIELDDGRELVIHLGMTGRIAFRTGPPDDDHPHLRAWWALGEGSATLEIMEFIDARRFGRLRVVATGDYRSIPTLATAGPEPWDPDLTPERFWQAIHGSSRPIKTQLLSQKPVAGVGNIYADEALWMAEINPIRRTLGIERATRLLDAVQIVMHQGIEAGGTTLRDYRNADGEQGANQHELAAYGRAGLPCLRCGEPLRSRVIDARTTVWCIACQRH